MAVHNNQFVRIEIGQQKLLHTQHLKGRYTVTQVQWLWRSPFTVTDSVFEIRYFMNDFCHLILSSIAWQIVIVLISGKLFSYILMSLRD